MNIDLKESNTIEFKKSLGEIEDVAKTIVAFSNTDGGDCAKHKECRKRDYGLTVFGEAGIVVA